MYLELILVMLVIASSVMSLVALLQSNKDSKNFQDLKKSVGNIHNTSENRYESFYATLATFENHINSVKEGMIDNTKKLLELAPPKTTATQSYNDTLFELRHNSRKEVNAKLIDEHGFTSSVAKKMIDNYIKDNNLKWSIEHKCYIEKS
jgi:type II secretory pathway pseudopilin PulG